VRLFRIVPVTLTNTVDRKLQLRRAFPGLQRVPVRTICLHIAILERFGLPNRVEFPHNVPE